jgi:hypothetical protein
MPGSYRAGAFLAITVAFIVLLPYVLPSNSGGGSNSTPPGSTTPNCDESLAAVTKINGMLTTMVEEQKSLLTTVQHQVTAASGVKASSTLLQDQVNALNVNMPKSTRPPQVRGVQAAEPACRAARTLKSWGCEMCGDDTCQYVDYGKNPCPELQEVFHEMSTYNTDINRLIPIIQSYAMRASSVVEMGSRRGHSTCAIMLSFPTNLTIIDLILTSDVKALGSAYEKCTPRGKKFKLIQSNDLHVTIGKTDMLFIDTLHDGSLLKQELAKHASQVTKWMLFHDVISFGHKDESTGTGIGLYPPLRDFMNTHKDEWEEEAYFPFSNGLLVLRRKVTPSECTWCFANTQTPREVIPWEAR